MTTTNVINNVTLTAAGVDQSNISRLTLQTGTQRVSIEALLTSSTPEAEKPCYVDVYYANSTQTLTANAAAVAQLYRIAKKLIIQVPLAPSSVTAQIETFLARGEFLYLWVNHGTKTGTTALTVTVNET